MDKLIAVLEKHLPVGTAQRVFNMLQLANIQLRITRKRKTKLGDFRPATRNLPHRISLNNDLNAYEFLFTFLHEMAHYHTFMRYGFGHKPHGSEWRNAFARLVEPFLNDGTFPPELRQGIIDHFAKKNVTDCNDHSLNNIFKRFDPPSKQNTESCPITVDMLPFNSSFRLPDGKKFIKLALRRKRFSCYCVSNKRMYVFGPKVAVIPEYLPALQAENK